MELITKLKNYKIILIFFLSYGTIAGGVTETRSRVPVIQNIGVIPVYWDEAIGDLPAKDSFDKEFGQSVRSAKRFQVASDELVFGLWGNTKGRTELKQQYELQGLVSLSILKRGDVFEISERLLDMGLTTLLLESENVTETEIKTWDKAKVRDFLDQLTFRMLNRLPVDITVTSQEGAYLTLSGGSDQGIKIGDEFDVVRPMVSALHPANGSWLAFKKEPMGRVKIVEVKTGASVAKIMRATHDDAIEIGDGARVGTIAGRARFLAKASSSEIAPPQVLAMGGDEDQGDLLPPPTTLPTQEVPTKEGVVDGPKPSTPSEAPKTSKTASSGPSMWDEIKGETGKHPMVDQVVFNIGPSLWSYEGSGIPSAKAKFPIWLFNSFGAGAERTFFYKIRGSAVGNLLLGSTSASTYFGYDFNARLFWEDDLNITDGFIKGWRGGIIGQLAGLSMNSGAFGGGDWWRGGIFGGGFGSVRFGEVNQRYDWYGNIGFMPMNIGRIGYNGSMRSVESAVGTFLEIGAFEYNPGSLLQWGGGFEYIDERQTLANGRRPHFSAINLKVLAKYRL